MDLTFVNQVKKKIKKKRIEKKKEFVTLCQKRLVSACMRQQ